LIVALCFGVYAVGFVATALFECKYREHSWRWAYSSNRRHRYSPWITPVPMFWPMVLVGLTAAAPFLALAAFVKFLTRGSASR
jgi:hypothetical protein